MYLNIRRRFKRTYRLEAPEELLQSREPAAIGPGKKDVACRIERAVYSEAGFATISTRGGKHFLIMYIPQLSSRPWWASEPKAVLPQIYAENADENLTSEHEVAQAGATSSGDG